MRNCELQERTAEGAWPANWLRCMMGELMGLAKKRYDCLFLVIVSQMPVGSLRMYIMQPWNSQADCLVQNPPSSFVLLMINMFIIVTANCSTSRAWYYITHILLSQPASGIVEEISEKWSLECSLSTLVGKKNLGFCLIKRIFSVFHQCNVDRAMISCWLTFVSYNKGLMCFCATSCTQTLKVLGFCSVSQFLDTLMKSTTSLPELQGLQINVNWHLILLMFVVSVFTLSFLSYMTDAQ